MIFVGQIAATIALLLVSSLGPGLYFIRYLRWRPLETLCGAVALSLLLQYLATAAIYGLELPPAWAYLSTALSCVATIVCARDLHRLWRHRETRATMLAFLALFSWLLLLLLLVRNYSGAGWTWDWLEHYQRAVFFSEHQPLDTKFALLYILPARPPMMNMLAAQWFWQVSPRFELFQIMFAFLNALVILPAALIAPSLVAKTRNRAWLIAGFLALSPMLVQNATYTWTKEFAAFYDLSALGLYLAAWRRKNAGLMIASFACLATAMLVHYSAAPWIIFLGGHYLFVLFRRRNYRWRELLAAAVVSTAIFSTWLGWSLYAYGYKETFASNTAVTASQQFSFSGNLIKISKNIFNTLVPFPLRGNFDESVVYNQPYRPQGLAYLRDWLFCIYQTSFPAMLGLGGLPLVIWLIAKFWLRSPRDHRQHRYGFWLWLTVIVTFLSIAVHGELDYFGVGHVCLQPLIILGLTLAAVGLPHVPRMLRGVALAGLLIDANLGILLPFFLMQNDFQISGSGEQVQIAAHIDMGEFSLLNGVTKYTHQLTFLGDHAVEAAELIQFLVVAGILGIGIGLWLLAARQTSGIAATAVPARTGPILF